jgi:hypothetical protein
MEILLHLSLSLFLSYILSLSLSIYLSFSELSISCILMRQAAIFQIRPIFKRQFFCPSPNMSSQTWNGFNEASCKGQCYNVIVIVIIIKSIEWRTQETMHINAYCLIIALLQLKY